MRIFDGDRDEVSITHPSVGNPLGKSEYSILFDYRIVRMKSQCFCVFLVVKNDLDLASLSGKPVFEFLGDRQQALFYAARSRADSEALLFDTQGRSTVTLELSQCCDAVILLTPLRSRFIVICFLVQFLV